MIINILKLLIIIALLLETYYIIQFYFKLDDVHRSLKSLNFRMQYIDKYISISEIIGYMLLSKPIKIMMMIVITFIKERRKKIIK